MSNPELHPFVEANACSTCPSNQFTTTSDNDDLSCQTVVQCTKALNGKVCQNGGTITGTVAANNCQCQCTQQLEGPNCEKCPSGMYLLNQNCVACGEGNDYSCPSGEFKSGTVCSGKFVASFGCCFFDLHVCFHCLLCLPYLTQVMVPPIHRRAWFVVTVGPLGCVPLVFRKVGLRAIRLYAVTKQLTAKILYICSVVTKVQRPCRITSNAHAIDAVLDVKPEATLASPNCT